MAQPAGDFSVDLPHYRSKVVRQLEDWRTGVSVCDLTTRNELLLEKEFMMTVADRRMP